MTVQAILVRIMAHVLTVNSAMCVTVLGQASVAVTVKQVCAKRLLCFESLDPFDRMLRSSVILSSDFVEF